MNRWPMLDYARDPQATAEAFEAGLLHGESYIDIAGHEHLRGQDKRRRWDWLYRLAEGHCADCGRFCTPRECDMAHRGKTTKTRCECINRVLNNGDICTGIDLLCTLDPRKGGTKNSCHSKRHNRETKFRAQKTEAA